MSKKNLTHGPKNNFTCDPSSAFSNHFTAKRTSGDTYKNKSRNSGDNYCKYSDYFDSSNVNNANENKYYNENDGELDELESLIQVLQYQMRTNDQRIRSIKYPDMLMTSLYELKNLVGMERLKDSIALQVMRLIDASNNGEKSSRMLNTILYGPPGVGKTKVGIILSKIWFSLGYLKKSSTVKASDAGAANAGFPNTTTTEISTGEGPNPLVTLGILFLLYGFAYVVSGVSYIYERLGFLWLLFIIFATMAIFVLLYWNKRTYTYITNIVTNAPEQEEIKMDSKYVSEIQDRDLITVVSRQDFVADYLGQTATKTKALLYKNLGKVVFIDEAYSLINGDRDSFGMEALTTLNLFMSEHPDSIAIIFAGYKDMMKHGIFHVQPGLPRRCMWHFECDRYTGNQLAEIFFRQVENDGWRIKEGDYEKIRDLICDNEDIFVSYGGDTERLLFFSQLEASRNNMLSQSHHISDLSLYSSSNHGSSMKSGEYCGKVLTYEHVQHGLKRLDENNIQDS